MRYEVAAAKMRAESLKATFFVIILSDVLGSAVAVDSMLTRGGSRLAAKAEAERATLYTDSGGKTWPLWTDAKENSGTVTEDRLRCLRDGSLWFLTVYGHSRTLKSLSSR